MSTFAVAGFITTFSIVTSRLDPRVSDYNGITTSFSVAHYEPLAFSSNDELLNIVNNNNHFTFYSTWVINTKTLFYSETREKKSLKKENSEESGRA